MGLIQMKSVLHTHERADNDDEVKHIPWLLEVVQPKSGNLHYGFQNKYPGKYEIGDSWKYQSRKWSMYASSI